MSEVAREVTSLEAVDGLPKAKPTGFPMLPFPNENGLDVPELFPVPNPNPDGEGGKGFDALNLLRGGADTSPASDGFDGPRKDENPGVRGGVVVEGLKLKGDDAMAFPWRAPCPSDAVSDVGIVWDSAEPGSSLTGLDMSGGTSAAEVCFSEEGVPPDAKVVLPNARGLDVNAAGLSEVPVLLGQVKDEEADSFCEVSSIGVKPAACDCADTSAPVSLPKANNDLGGVGMESGFVDISFFDSTGVLVWLEPDVEELSNSFWAEDLNDLYFSSISEISTKGSAWNARLIASRKEVFIPRRERQYLWAASRLDWGSEVEGVLGGVGFEVGTKDNPLADIDVDVNWKGFPVDVEAVWDVCDVVFVCGTGDVNVNAEGDELPKPANPLNREAGSGDWKVDRALPCKIESYSLDTIPSWSCHSTTQLEQWTSLAVKQPPWGRVWGDYVFWPNGKYKPLERI
jgi:hypothetical protein